MSTGLSDLKVTHWRPLTHQLSFCEMGPHPVVFPCHVLGRAGTCHLFFFFFPIQFLPLELGLSPLGLFHYYNLQRRGPRTDPTHILIATIRMSVLQYPRSEVGEGALEGTVGSQSLPDVCFLTSAVFSHRPHHSVPHQKPQSRVSAGGSWKPQDSYRNLLKLFPQAFAA